MSLPDFLIVGVGKGGTTSLYATLAKHPQIQAPIAKGIPGKELAFFTERWTRGLRWYRAQFPKRKPGCLLFEATPSYISDSLAPGRIRKTLPDVKAIVLLRDPVARTWSDYTLRYRRPPHNHPVSRLSDPNYGPVRRSIYVDQIERWHGLFPKERLLILRSEDYFAEPMAALAKVTAFLGIEAASPDIVTKWDPWEDKKRRWGYEPIPDDVRETLERIFEPHNERLRQYMNATGGTC